MTDTRKDRPLSTPSRRHVLQRGAAVMGIGLISPVANASSAQQREATPRYDVKTFGATGLRTDSATKAFQSAIDACSAAGGGTVHVPPGAYTVGMIELKDNTTLHLDAGATLLLSQSDTEFPRGRRAMIFSENATNIGVTGRGTLDGLAQYVFTEMRDIDPEIREEIEIARAAGVDMRRYYRTGVQTYMFIFNACRNVLLRDIRIVGSPLWNVRLNDCDRVHVHGVEIRSDLEKGVNADGIDIVSSRNVLISDSVIETADDAIVLKAIGRDGQPARPTENVTVTNCVLASSSTPLMIGTETEADIRHVLFTNCVIRNSNKGFGINVQDGAVVSDVIFSHLTIETNRRHWNWWGSAEMCKFVLKRRTPTSRLGMIRNIVVDTVIAHARGTSTVVGHPEQPIQDVRFSNIQVHMLPEDAPDKRASHALAVEHVRDLRVRDFSVRWSESAEPKWRSALSLRHVVDFALDGFDGRQGSIDAAIPAIVLDHAVSGTIINARGTAGCRRLVHVRTGTHDIEVSNCRISKDGAIVTFEDTSLERGVKVTG